MLRMVLTSFALLLPAATSAQMFIATGRDTLRGLPGVEIAVEVAQPELASRGLAASAIRAGVERRLGAGGVPVYASQNENPGVAKAFLYVHVNALELPANAGFAVGYQVHLRQTVRSAAGDSQIVDAMTWDSHNVVAVGPTGLAEVLGEIEASVDAFVRDWKATRP